MRKLILIDMVSLDGLYEGPGEGFATIDWHMVDDRWNEKSVETLDNSGTILFGRRTYEGFRGFWPTQSGSIADRINAKDKAVVSKSLAQAGWANARVLRGDLRSEVEALKAETGKQIIIYGSGRVGQSLTDLGLIDEYHLAIAPVVVGTGTPLFKAEAPRLQMKLNSVEALPNGVLYASYSPAL